MQSPWLAVARFVPLVGPHSHVCLQAPLDKGLDGLPRQRAGASLDSVQPALGQGHVETSFFPVSQERTTISILSSGTTDFQAGTISISKREIHNLLFPTPDAVAAQTGPPGS